MAAFMVYEDTSQSGVLSHEENLFRRSGIRGQHGSNGGSGSGLLPFVSVIPGSDG